MKFTQLLPVALSFATSALAQSFCTGATHTGESVKETGNKVGSIGGVGYEMWADSGNNSATFYSDGSFSCSFSNAKDYLCRSGLSFDSTQSHSQIGHMYADFKLVKQDISNVDYSYVGIYGWTRDPLVEFYIVDNWLSQYRPGDWVGNKKHGDFTIDGAEYTVFENTRFGPSIDGDTQFKQYFSIRQTPRDCGTIDISAHFAQWEKLGMTMGKMHEAKVLGEAGSNGAGTSGTADFPYAKVYIGQGNGGSAVQENNNEGINFDQGNQWNQGGNPWDQGNNNNNQWNNNNNNNNNQWNQGGNPWDQGNNNNQWNQIPQNAASSTNENCVGLWGQCGGIGYSGSSCCSEGSCKVVSEYFHQCQL
ncbi:concanavalin A-like lectin/glucanase [Piromyces finnis]|uniref:Endo-1,4-beta-xylanase n=1 Tax=Piromyces finnis TaxID=1754191 RepID=A0A1Y1V2H9_9FUNG|nr:concanavalin A-like lectin/glucanase [Piromyces finnis]|eukprot:ORX45772.1 concanavalin A-like lectin/glucanase [Piromyces finnis]